MFNINFIFLVFSLSSGLNPTIGPLYFKFSLYFKFRPGKTFDIERDLERVGSNKH